MRKENARHLPPVPIVFDSEMLPQRLFFDMNAIEKRQTNRYHRAEQAQPIVEDERQAEEVQQHARVRRVSHSAVPSRIDQLLTLVHTNSGGEPLAQLIDRLLADDHAEEVETRTERYQQCVLEQWTGDDLRAVPNANVVRGEDLRGYDDHPYDE